LKKINQPQNFKVILFKLVKKIENILEMYEKDNNNCIPLKLIMVKFYILHLPNNIKLSQLFSNLTLKKISWKQRVLLFIYYNKIHKEEEDGSSSGHNSTNEMEYTIFRMI